MYSKRKITEIDSHIARVLNEYIEGQGSNIKAISRMTGLDYQKLCAALRGDREFSAKEVYLCAIYLDIGFGELFEATIALDALPEPGRQFVLRRYRRVREERGAYERRRR